MKNTTVKKATLDFLFYSYLGVSPDEVKDEKLYDIAIKCAKRAYLDFNRTLTFKENISDEVRTNFKDKMCEVIVNIIRNNIFNSSVAEFDNTHSAACDEICKEVKKYSVLAEKKVKKEDEDKGVEQSTGFRYGQAQKWLNMTIKYMWLMGLWDEQLEPLATVLHIPIDSYILEAIWHENHKDFNEKPTFIVSLPCYKENSRYKKYGDDKVVSWSRWNADMYTGFQTTLRSYIKDCTNYKSALDWEGPAWIEIAKNRKK